MWGASGLELHLRRNSHFPFSNMENITMKCTLKHKICFLLDKHSTDMPKWLLHIHNFVANTQQN